MMVVTVQGVDNIALIIIIVITFMKSNNNQRHFVSVFLVWKRISNHV